MECIPPFDFITALQPIIDPIHIISKVDDYNEPDSEDSEHNISMTRDLLITTARNTICLVHVRMLEDSLFSIMSFNLQLLISHGRILGMGIGRAHFDVVSFW